MLRKVLASLMAAITNHPRYLPNIEWSSSSWTHNVFRIWELVFGRRVGVRAEMSSSTFYKNGRWHRLYSFHTAEAAIAHFESVIRNGFEKLIPDRVYFPQLAGPGGIPVPSQFGILMAVAYDAVSSSAATATTLTTTHTCTGSDRYLTAGGSGRQTISAASYNSVAMTSLGTPAFNSPVRAAMYGLLGPDSGGNTLSMTFGGTYNVLGGISFTGAGSVSGYVSNTGSSTTVSLTVVSVSTSIVVDCIDHGDDGNPTATGSGQTARYATNNADAAGGSTKTGAASTAMTWTRPGSSVWATVGVSVDMVVPAYEGAYSRASLLAALSSIPRRLKTLIVTT